MKKTSLLFLLSMTLAFAAQAWAQGGKELLKNPEPPAAVIDESKTYIIVSSSSGLVLDVAGASKDDYAPVNQYPRHNGTNQQWRFQSAGGGLYHIVGVNSGKALDIHGGSVAPSAKLIQYTKGPQANQKFKLVKNGDAYQIIASHSKMALDVPGASSSTVQIQQYPVHGNANQLWKLVAYTPPPPPPPFVSPIDGPLFVNGSNLGLTVLNQSIGNNTPIILHEGLNQWTMLSNGAIVLKSNPKYGLTVLNQNKVNGAKIILHEGYNTWTMLSNGAIVLKDNPRMGITVLNQNLKNGAEIILHEGYNTWTKENTQNALPTSGKTYRIMNAHGNRALCTLHNSQDPNNKGNQEPIIQYDFYGDATQKWTFESMGNGLWAIKNVAGGKALCTMHNSQDPNNKGNQEGIIQYDYYGDATQKWVLKSLGNGYFAIMNAHGNRALCTMHNSQDPNNKGNQEAIIQYDFYGDATQKWKIEEVAR